MKHQTYSCINRVMRENWNEKRICCILFTLFLGSSVKIFRPEGCLSCSSEDLKESRWMYKVQSSCHQVTFAARQGMIEARVSHEYRGCE